jgi:signal transduction histidine kinase
LTAKIQKHPRADSVVQELRDEIDALRSELAAAKASIESRDYRSGTFSRMLNLGIWEWDEIEGKPIFYSEQMAEVYGVDADDFESGFTSQTDFERLVHRDDLEHFREQIDGQILEPGVPNIFDYRIITGKREIRYLREYVQGLFDDRGTLTASFGMVQDVTDSQQAIAALKASEERYHSLFEQMPLGVQEEDYSAVKKVVDKLLFQGVDDLRTYFLENPIVLREMVGQTRITNVNEALLRLHEADSKEEFIDIESDVDGWWDATWVDYYAAEIAALAGERRFHDSERVDSRVDGSYFETRTLVTVVRGYEDSWQRVITIHEDITKRKQGEASLIEAKNQAEQANQAKSEFLSSMSHELRTPLNAILGFSQLFAYDRELDEQHLANAAEINRAGRHLMSLIDQVLDLSRIEAGDTSLSMEPISLRQVLADSVHWVVQLAKNRDVAIHFDEVEFEGLSVVADNIRLKQVFLNLLTNAVKYNRAGGEVNLILDKQDDDYLRIGVRDTGSGISSEKLEELFQPFNRLGAEFSTIEGTGIGLVITRQLLDMMQGELEIDSETGVGSTFWVRLQATQLSVPTEDDRRQDTTVTSITEPGAASSRILVAEDNLINQELMAAQLEILGYRADYAENGVQALEAWRQRDYGLLLTDIRMPEMNGYDLVREIRLIDQDRQGHTPIVALGRGRRPDCQAGRARGFARRVVEMAAAGGASEG